MQRNCNKHHMQLSRWHLFFTLTTLVRNSIAYTYHMPQTNVRTEVLHPCNALWYLPNICSRISQACLCNSASKWQEIVLQHSDDIPIGCGLNRTSSNSGMSHSRRTIKVCTSLKTLVTLSKPIIQPMSWSLHCLVQRSGVGAIVHSMAQIWRNSLITNTSIPDSDAPKLVTFKDSDNLSPDKLSEFSLVQTPLLCLQDLLPTSACRDIFKHPKKMSFQAINWQVTFIKWPYSQHAQKKWNKTSPESRILKLFDALDFTLAAYQPSDHYRTLVQAQHISLNVNNQLANIHVSVRFSF